MACATSATPAYAADDRRSSSAGGVAIRKAARQCQPHARAAGGRDQIERRTAACGAASHVAQAARRFLTGRGGCAILRERKSRSVVFDTDAAISARRVGEGFDGDHDAARASML